MDFWSQVSDAQTIPVDSYLLAELSKVIENIHRDVNIALANELFPLVAALGVNYHHLQAAANTHPRVQLLKPGPGVGGYCLPNALSYLLPPLKKYGLSAHLMETAREINLLRPKDIAERVVSLAHPRQVAILGVGMKDNCSDPRFSPALEIEKIFRSQGIETRIYDPVIEGYNHLPLTEVLKGVEAIVVTALQPGMGAEEILEAVPQLAPAPPIFDPKMCIPDQLRPSGVEVYYV